MRACALAALVVVTVAACGGDDTSTPAAATVSARHEAGSWIAFQGADGRIRLVRPDGTDEHAPFEDLPGGEQQHPEWSPDGSQLLFAVRDAQLSEDIWIASADGSDAQVLVDCERPCVWADEPAWSPVGRRVAFQRVVGEAAVAVSTVEVLDLDDGSIDVVHTAATGDFSFGPRWSPDGRTLLVEHVETAAGDIEGEILGVRLDLLPIDGGAPRTLVEATRYVGNADWHPSGDRIVFAARPDAASESLDLHTIGPDGTGEVRLTTFADRGGSADHASFTPDGEGVIFIRNIGADTETEMAVVDLTTASVAPATATGYQFGLHPRVQPAR